MKQRREILALTQQDLAEMAQVGLATVKDIERGIGYSFQYIEDYLNSPMPPISATLPKQKGIFNSENLFPFFINMIPEGANRKVICRTQRIDEDDFFGILEAMANKDFIGAVNIRRINNG